MAREPMSQNQKFALLIFAIVVGVAVIVVYLSVRASIAAM